MLEKRRKKVGGVCAGLARYFGADVPLRRVIWRAGAIASGGWGVFAYLARWIVILRKPRKEPVFEPHRA